ncbi:MAG TPA: hypothetical protein VJM31_08730 [Vicinamibacterales bacterium]|nr:hypothetical protein [Vicinamibacterales bacterium]
MKFVFVGNGDGDQEEITMYGVTFQLNGPGMEVTDPEGIRKLSWNNHFRQGDKADPVPVKRKPGRPKKPAKIEQVEVGDDD